MNKSSFMGNDDEGAGSEPEPHIILDVCTILDCILDDSFVDGLELTIPHHYVIRFFPTIISIIASRSPRLKKLHVRFVEFVRSSGERTVMMLSWPDVLQGQLPSLQHFCLTNVTLSFRYRVDPRIPPIQHPHGSSNFPLTIHSENETILSILTGSCPVLSDLLIKRFGRFNQSTSFIFTVNMRNTT